MSLQLFANNESTLNSSLFYREATPSGSYQVKFRIFDSTNPSKILNEQSYVAFFTLNGKSAPTRFDKNLTTVLYLSSNPGTTHFVNVDVYRSSDYFLVQQLSMSAIFVDSNEYNNLNNVTFNAFPSGFITSTPYVDLSGIAHYYSVIDDYGSTDSYLNTLIDSGFTCSFYGEGHTENIILSSNFDNQNYTALWNIGDTFSTTTSSNITHIPVSSSPNVSETLPITLRLFNNTFLKNGPVITYNDITGEPSYYPFYKSSRNPNTTLQSTDTLFNTDLVILKYPEPQPYEYSLTPFYNTTAFSILQDFTKDIYNRDNYTWQVSQGANIPYYSYKKQFTANFKWPINTDYPFYRYFTNINWNLYAITNFATNIPDWSVSLTTPSLQVPYSTTGKNPYNPNSNAQNDKFNFTLSYSKEADIVNQPLKVSLEKLTNVTMSVTGTTTLGIQRGLNTNLPNDWKFKTYQTTSSFTVNIYPPPIAKLYFPNYYVLPNTDVLVNSVYDNNYWNAYDPYIYGPAQSTINYNNSTLTLTANEVGVLSFQQNDAGTIDIPLHTIIRDPYLFEYNLDYTLPNQLEVVTTYDIVEPNHYHSVLSPLKITHKKAPRLSPNEWVTSDNINSVVDKIFSYLNDLDSYSSIYTPKNKLTGILQQKYNPYRTTSYNLLTSYFVPNDSVLTFQDYEILTITGNSTINTYLASNSNNLFVEVPYFLLVNANVPTRFTYQWLIESIDPFNFNSWQNILPTYPTFVDFGVISNSNLCVMGYRDKITLTNNQYLSEILAIQNTTDNVLPFRNIQAVKITSKDYIIVLDSEYPTISVFTISNNNFNLYTTWGQQDTKLGKRGFLNPHDIHIDQDDAIWIADTGNNCIKKFNINGKFLQLIDNDVFSNNAPISVCVDSQRYLHVLTQNGIYVFDQNGNYSHNYVLPSNIIPNKINTSYNREIIYVVHSTGILKYFRTGEIFEYLITTTPLNYSSVQQDQFRNVFITVDDKVIKIADLMRLDRYRSSITNNNMWTPEQTYVDKEEYVQPWVYLKTFHRLWDNIEIFRNSLFYEINGRRTYSLPIYAKEDLVIGQNEIVMNSVINRLITQLWTNLDSIYSYFDNLYNPPQKLINPGVTPIPSISLPTPSETFAPTPTPSFVTPTPTPSEPTPTPRHTPFALATPYPSPAPHDIPPPLILVLPTPTAPTPTPTAPTPTPVTPTPTSTPTPTPTQISGIVSILDSTLFFVTSADSSYLEPSYF